MKPRLVPLACLCRRDGFNGGDKKAWTTIPQPVLWLRQEGKAEVMDERATLPLDKKRPNTIPVFGPGKWLLGESRALKVGINAGSVALPFKNR
ncbi:hypothetical protein R2300_000184 [Cronobacter turicensis]|nr:hypothetical protein [Cronobacter turicensis]ELQ6256560.1 hypothetical protein [Cronobacter turicensis]NCH61902.1 hypothetical protein [Cronobacter turicensis]